MSGKKEKSFLILSQSITFVYVRINSKLFTYWLLNLILIKSPFGVIDIFRKKSKKSERKYKNRNSISSDDKMYPDINYEQTPEYLSAIAQFLERR